MVELSRVDARFVDKLAVFWSPPEAGFTYTLKTRNRHAKGTGAIPVKANVSASRFGPMMPAGTETFHYWADDFAPYAFTYMVFFEVLFNPSTTRNLVSDYAIGSGISINTSGQPVIYAKSGSSYTATGLAIAANTPTVLIHRWTTDNAYAPGYRKDSWLWNVTRYVSGSNLAQAWSTSVVASPTRPSYTSFYVGQSGQSWVNIWTAALWHRELVDQEIAILGNNPLYLRKFFTPTLDAGGRSLHAQRSYYTQSFKRSMVF